MPGFIFAVLVSLIIVAVTTGLFDSDDDDFDFYDDYDNESGI